MKRLLNALIMPILLAGMAVTLMDVSVDAPINVTVYGESDTGYTWVRTYTGAENNVSGLVSGLNDSYARLTESMNAGSALKVYVQGVLVSESSHIGSPESMYSGVQITVHDTFARKHNFTTTDALPHPRGTQEDPIEPFVCGKK